MSTEPGFAKRVAPQETQGKVAQTTVVPFN